MTITQETTTDANVHDPATGPAVPDNGAARAETAQDDRKPPREQRYRLERNSAREALSAAETRLADLQTRELHRLASEHLAQPEDIGLSGKALADYLTSEGWIDHEAVAEAAAAVIESRPGLAKSPKVRATDHTQGSGAEPFKQPVGWSDLFRP
jgi:hypothetical protein